MSEHVTDDDLELLGELGADTAPAPAVGRTAKEQRIIAGFEEIEKFVEEHGRAPEPGEGRDIFERLYALRLDRMRESPECREVLKDLDSRGLLGAGNNACADAAKDEPDDEELLASLGAQAAENDVSRLVHVRSREEIKAAEEIAQRNPCKDFEKFKPIFEKVQAELETGKRQTTKYKHDAEIMKGDLFILGGQKVLVADFLTDQFVSDYGRHNRRLRVVYDNGTESDLLARSLQRALYKDEANRRIIEAGAAPLFSDDEEEDDLATGYIYVLRSKSEHPFVAEHRNLIHKIGVTGGDVESRVASAKKDPTYLLADVEIVRIFKLANLNRRALERLLHKLFAAARLDLELKDRFGAQVEPKEWFLLPLPVLDEAVQKVIEGTIDGLRYDPETARLTRA